jgi:hypothetical protein
MKKLFTLALIGLLGLLAINSTYAITVSDYSITLDNGNTLETDNDVFQWKFRLHNNEVYIVPDHVEFSFTDNVFFSFDNNFVAEILDPAPSPNGTYNLLLDLQLNFVDGVVSGDSILNHYDHIVITDESNRNELIYIPLSNQNRYLRIFYEYEYESPDYYTSAHQSRFYDYNSVEYGNFRGSEFSIKLLKLLPDEQNWITSSNKQYWTGFGNASLQTNFLHTFNYFVKYLNTYVLPYASDATDAMNRALAYRHHIQNTGIILELPPNFGIDLFVPINFLNGIDYWLPLTGQFTTLTITVPDLTLDGGIDTINGVFQWSGEVWGDTLNYNVDGTDFTYGLLNEFLQTIPPIFGVRIASEYYQVSFNANGGTPNTTQWVGSGGNVIRPNNPTRTGYNFCSWTNTPQPLIAPENFVFQCTPQFTVDVESFTITANRTFYARWSAQVLSVNLVLNGGIIRQHPNFTSPTLYVAYNTSANDNIYDVPFNNIVTRFEHTLVGWYLDPNFTQSFNPNAPLTSSTTIYARWVKGDIGTGEAPTGINGLLADIGLFNSGGLILIYIVVLAIMIFATLSIGLGGIIILIEIIAVTGIWMFLGWFNAYAIIVIILAIILGVIMEIRR